MTKKVLIICAGVLTVAALGRAQQPTKVVEEIVARVNNEIITRGDLARADSELKEEAQQDCAACTPDQLRDKIQPAEKDLLRDLIDNSLLVQRGKDLNINVETDVIKRLDDIRQENKLASMEDLERQASESGVDFEDFKNDIRNHLIQQEVIRREVGSKIIMDHADVQKYYDEHKAEFVRPEQVALREIFVSTEKKQESDAPALRKKADDLLLRVKNGDDFGELAKHFSDGSTAKDGGELGTFEHGQLAANIEAIVFKMNHGDVTDVMPTKTGFLILQVREHYPAGQQPESKVEEEIMSKMYSQKMEPALRVYLKTLREDSYVDVKPGYVDTAAVSTNPIEEVPASPDESGKKKKSGHRLIPFGKKNGA